MTTDDQPDREVRRLDLELVETSELGGDLEDPDELEGPDDRGLVAAMKSDERFRTYNPQNVSIRFGGVELASSDFASIGPEPEPGDQPVERASVSFDIVQTPEQRAGLLRLVTELRSRAWVQALAEPRLRAVYLNPKDLEELLDDEALDGVTRRRTDSGARLSLDRPYLEEALELRAVPEMEPGTVLAGWACPRCRGSRRFKGGVCSRCLGTGEVIAAMPGAK